MATLYSISVSDEQQQVLDWLVNQINIERGSKLTVAQFIQGRITDLILPHQLRFIEAMQKEVSIQFSSADKATRDQVLTLLGVK